jgi:hypothetical protein
MTDLDLSIERPIRLYLALLAELSLLNVNQALCNWALKHLNLGLRL